MPSFPRQVRPHGLPKSKVMGGEAEADGAVNHHSAI